MPSRSNWNLEMLVFAQRERPKYQEKKPLRAKERTNKQTQPKYIDTMPYWWLGRQMLSSPAQPLKIKHNNSTSGAYLYLPSKLSANMAPKRGLK